MDFNCCCAKPGSVVYCTRTNICKQQGGTTLSGYLDGIGEMSSSANTSVVQALEEHLLYGFCVSTDALTLWIGIFAVSAFKDN